MKLAVLAAFALFLATMLRATAAADLCTNDQPTYPPPDAECGACASNGEADKDGDCVCDSVDAFPANACEHKVAIDKNGEEILNAGTGKNYGANEYVVVLKKKAALEIFQTYMKEAKKKKDASFKAPFAQFNPALHCTPPRSDLVIGGSIGRKQRDNDGGYGYGIAEMLERCLCQREADSATSEPVMDFAWDMQYVQMGDLKDGLNIGVKSLGDLPQKVSDRGTQTTMLSTMQESTNKPTGIPGLCEVNNCETFPLFDPSNEQHCERVLQLAEYCTAWAPNAANSIECPQIVTDEESVPFNPTYSLQLPMFPKAEEMFERKRRLAARVDKFPAFLMQMHDAYGRGTGYFEYNRATARFTSKTITGGELYYQLDTGTADNFLNGISSKPIFVTRGGPDATSPTVKGRFQMPLPGDVNHYRITKTDSDLPLSTNEVMFSMAVDHTWHVEHCRSMVSNGPPKGEVDGAEPLTERLRHFTHCAGVVKAGTK